MKWFLKLNLPNKITLARMIIVVFVILVALLPDALNWAWPSYNIFGLEYSLQRIILLALFVIGSISDFLDGNIARKRGIVTTFGKFLDPIADKLLVNVLYMILAFWHEVPVIVIIVFIVRDTIVDAIRLIASEKKVVIAASIWGKAKTVVQMVAMIVILLQIPYAVILAYIAGVISLISGIDYFIKNRKFILEGADYNGK